ncbi:hypothetical protein EVAR_44019_1 [Eumeta japonica]|uniref:Uncharacterized protein n=1 Tax=Eumeta variegata TaxID=151549 RepID=A0A4C1XDN9_EUMVA|nr:hypothetical protein EVAR_44019_1 [Eumeta japonica]
MRRRRQLIPLRWPVTVHEGPRRLSSSVVAFIHNVRVGGAPARPGRGLTRCDKDPRFFERTFRGFPMRIVCGADKPRAAARAPPPPSSTVKIVSGHLHSSARRVSKAAVARLARPYRGAVSTCPGPRPRTRQ